MFAKTNNQQRKEYNIFLNPSIYTCELSCLYLYVALLYIQFNCFEKGLVDTPLHAHIVKSGQSNLSTIDTKIC